MLLGIIKLYLVIINIISVIVCCYDKLMAIKGRRRISEKTLLTLSALGGSIAMLFTMCLIRHKTRHLKFMLGIPLIIALQITVLLLILKNIA
jgi:uncharacterized membrane protein YsdA (DUF1294 family)